MNGTDELKRLIEAREQGLGIDLHLAGSFLDDHASALLARLERYEAALREYSVVTIGAWDYGERARAALNDGQEKA